MSDADTLYNEYRNLCIERGVFPLGRNQVRHNDEMTWLIYSMALIRTLTQSPEERAADNTG